MSDAELVESWCEVVGGAINGFRSPYMDKTMESNMRNGMGDRER